MGKNGTSRRRERSWSGIPLELGPHALARPFDPTEELRDPAFIREAIFQALKQGDYEGVVTIYRAHLRVLNRTRTAKALNVSRQYVHKMLKQHSNVPSLRTFTAFMKVLDEGVRKG